MLEALGCAGLSMKSRQASFVASSPNSSRGHRFCRSRIRSTATGFRHYLGSNGSQRACATCRSTRPIPAARCFAARGRFGSGVRQRTGACDECSNELQRNGSRFPTSLPRSSRGSCSRRRKRGCGIPSAFVEANGRIHIQCPGTCVVSVALPWSDRLSDRL